MLFLVAALMSQTALAGSIPSQAPAPATQVPPPGSLAPPEASPGRYFAPAFALEASFRYKCPERDVVFSIDEKGDKMRLVALDIGAASTPETIQEINRSLDELFFERALVSCAGVSSIRIQFIGWRDDGGEEASRASVEVASSAAGRPAVRITNSWSEPSSPRQ